jgi:hypothetical protein
VATSVSFCLQAVKLMSAASSRLFRVRLEFSIGLIY